MVVDHCKTDPLLLPHVWHLLRRSFNRQYLSVPAQTRVLYDDAHRGLVQCDELGRRFHGPPCTHPPHRPRP